ncbi:MAG: DNA repair protein RecO [Pseudomonadota bacterium]
MITWTDEAALLASRPFGETSVIVEVFTAEHGRHAGVVKGGTSRKVAPHLQPGAQLQVTWKARLDAHLGSFAVEPLRSRAAAAMADRLSLAGLNTVCALLALVLPEREPHPTLFIHTMNLLDLLDQTELWPLAYLRWEEAVLRDLGFGLDLSACAVTGGTEDLIYVSPKSGRAVSAHAAGDWADRMLPLPPVLGGQGEATGPEIARALGTTGYFIENRLLRSLGDRGLPAARQRLIDTIARQSA